MAGERPSLSTRRRLRLPGYDYSAPGGYFVTICTYRRRCIFSRIEVDQSSLTALGRIVVDEWLRTTMVHRGVRVDAFVVMPNHFHAVVLLEADARDRPLLGVVINRFKSAVTREARRRGSRSVEVWQRGYYEHIICSDQDLQAIREYIEINPARWSEDQNNPGRRSRR